MKSDVARRNLEARCAIDGLKLNPPFPRRRDYFRGDSPYTRCLLRGEKKKDRGRYKPSHWSPTGGNRILGKGDSMTRGHPVLCEIFRRNDKTRVATKEREREGGREEERKKRADRLVATISWQETRSLSYTYVRGYDAPKSSPRAYLHALGHNNGIEPYTKCSWLCGCTLRWRAVNYYFCHDPFHREISTNSTIRQRSFERQFQIITH